MYEYEYTYAVEEGVESMLGLMGIQLAANFVTFIISIVSYVLLAIGLYTIAKRRGIKHPWLAWIPVGDAWLLGCISDQYHYVARGEVKSKRKWMLGLSIVVIACAVLMIVVAVSMLVNVINVGLETNFVMDDATAMELVLGPVLSILGLCFLVIIPSISLAVLEYIALYDLYASCEPSNKVLYLVLGIFFGIVTPIFVFICRNKDLGMPPRRDQMFQQPAWQQPLGQPTWQPPQPPAEPWEQKNEE